MFFVIFVCVFVCLCCKTTKEFCYKQIYFVFSCKIFKTQQKTFVMTGEKVKNVIIAKGYSVAQVAEMIGTSQQNLASGLKHTDVRSGLLEKIAAALSIPVLEFYGEEAPSGFTVRVQGTGNTSVAGNANTVNGVDKTLLDLLSKKEEQLTLTIKQVSKAQEQMDRVLERLEVKDAVHTSEN